MQTLIHKPLHHCQLSFNLIILSDQIDVIQNVWLFLLNNNWVCVFGVSSEEERKVKANDREYNEKFQYAVRINTASMCCKYIFQKSENNCVKIYVLWFFFFVYLFFLLLE